MLSHIAHYLLAYLVVSAIVTIGYCYVMDKKRGYLSNPFKK